MIYIQTLLYYTLFASSVLIYGVGINRIVEVGITKISSILYYVKAIITILSTSMLTWLISNFILLPLGLVELFPLIAFLIFILINTFIEALIRLTTGKSSTEFIVSFLIILLSVYESVTFLDTVIICVSCFMSLLLLFPLSITFKKRLCSNGQLLDERYYSFFFIFLTVIIIILSVWDIGWLNTGVIQ